MHVNPTLTIRKVLLICGIIASVLYATINVVVARQWNVYDPASQTVSELSAVGAPTRTLWLAVSAPYTLLMIAFALGVRQSAGHNRRLRITGNLLLAYSLLGILWPFAPMHLRPVLATGGSTVSDTLHLALGAVTELIYMLALAFAALALGNAFRNYSVITFIFLLVFGVLTFLEAPNVADNKPTPLIGVWERVNIGVFLLWVIVLALKLLPEKEHDSPHAVSEAPRRAANLA